VRRRVTALAARLAGVARRRERAARAAIGMPAGHPERITAELPEAQEQWLAAVAGRLWPADEYTHIVTDTHREGP
jgi:hypothetical protein